MTDEPESAPRSAPPGAWNREGRHPPAMTFGTAIRTCMSRYATFSGRASRPEYWWFVLFLCLGQAAAGIVDTALFGVDGAAALAGPLFGLATLLPALAAGWRRMHDSGRSGLHLLYPLIVMFGIASFGAVAVGIPDGAVQDVSVIVLAVAGLALLISPLLVLWWLTRPSDPYPNRYGPPPAEVTP